MASPATIVRWICDMVAQAYALKVKEPPFPIKANSIRAVGASWAFCHGASVSQVYKAATWLSVHTLARFYKVDVSAFVDASLGCKILQVAL